ncbi:MAG: hypothetical protein K8R77_10520 [Anaerolineaceae bacterium]|nr:hypothetical protein [Anaerolineaceae bacterium]
MDGLGSRPFVKGMAFYASNKSAVTKLTQKHGVRFAWLTTGKSILRFLKAPFVKRDLFTDQNADT